MIKEWPVSPPPPQTTPGAEANTSVYGGLKPSDEVRRVNTDYSQGARPVDEPRTIADVLSHASVAIARIAGVAPEKVKLDPKIES